MSGLIFAFDTETHDLPVSYDAHPNDVTNWPRVVQLGWVLADRDGRVIEKSCELVQPGGWEITPGAQAVHGISQEECVRYGRPLQFLLSTFHKYASRAEIAVAHNIGFDRPVILCESIRYAVPQNLPPMDCTMAIGRDVCKIPKGDGFKRPSLSELYRHLFGEVFTDQHDALADSNACLRCYVEMAKRGFE